jgi:DNA-binding SARP family transcriptional activator
LPESGNPLRIQLLGEFCVWVGSRRLDEAEWRLRKAKSLVKLLALAPGHRLHREQVMDALWPELDAEAAANNLHKTLHVARRALEPDLSPPRSSVYLQLQGDLVVLRPPGPLEIDVECFEAALDSARKTADIAAHEAAVAWYGGDLLPEDRYEEWVAGRREELSSEMTNALVGLADLQAQDGAIEAATSTLRRVIARDPAHEPAHRSLMRLYSLAGQRHQALRQYQQLRAALRRELDAEPETETEQLYQEVLSGAVGREREEPGATPAMSLAGPDAVLSEPLVGRDDEVERLEDILDRLFSGEGRLVLLAGEAGVGKSRLQREIAGRVRRRSGIILSGAGYEQEGRLPYGPFVEALEELAQRISGDDWKSLAEDISAELSRLVPAFGVVPVQTGPAVTHDRRRLFSAVATFLGRLGEQVPVLVLLDDLHAADEASLQLLHYLARNLRSRPVLLVAAHRPEEAGPSAALGQFLAAVEREGIGEHLDLERISQPDSELLVDLHLGGEPVERAVYQAVFELAAGNPLYTEEAVRSLREKALLEKVEGRWTLRGDDLSIPGPVVSLISARIDRLPAAERAVLNIAAVSGRETPYALLRAASDLAEGDLLDALDDCLVHRVLEEAPQGYRFVHPLQRAALYERLSSARRGYLHGRVAAALEELHPGQLEAHAEALAHHYLNSEKPGLAVPHLITAGERAAGVYANEAATEAYRRALELLGTPGAPDQTPRVVADLWERMGDLHRLTGEQERDVAAYESALTALKGGEQPTAVRLHRKAAYACVAQHLPDRAESHLTHAFSILAGQPDQAERGRALRVQAHLLWERGDYAEGVKAAEESLAFAEQVGDVADAISAYTTLALVFHSHGEWQRGLSFVVEHLGVQADDPGLAELFDAHL